MKGGRVALQSRAFLEKFFRLSVLASKIISSY